MFDALNTPSLTRRQILRASALGFGSLALAALEADSSAVAEEREVDFASGRPRPGFLADRVLAETPDESPSARIQTACRIVIGRHPDETELPWCLDFLERQQREFNDADANHAALTQLCHMLLNTNEFLYVP